jgi:hypothetical protein
MMTTFRDALRMVDDIHLLDLRARFVALDDTAMAIPAIDLEVAERKQAYYAEKRNVPRSAPAPLATARIEGKIAADSVPVR